MVAKKRTGLRAKAARVTNTEKDDVVQQVTDLPPDPKAFLHQPRETKKEKSQIKSQNFLSRITDTGKSLSGISKSSARRRKRKMRDDLKPKLDDLLTSLQDEGVAEKDEPAVEADTNGESKPASSVTKVVRSDAYGRIRYDAPQNKGQLRKNEPNIRNQKGAKMLAQQESKRFNEVLLNESFQKNPFDALKEAIRMRQ
ncbi:unnamed protein product [Kluyveromyces dobzhanskii CBS 2104]|uniref:Ribosome biogenesis protein SLX9 n=1 Tax=Kluyveromyces dobzhanskii CBS 2104 TaxID=1427455 RepID=A0A0A8L2A4_9SACH|nr:unnamed protein product [Kluyveromyces dobzhanskii CBS 2104]